MKKLKILSLFDGISATNQALKNLGIEYDYYASEIDKYAIQVTQKNFPNTVQLGDVKDIWTHRLNSYDAESYNEDDGEPIILHYGKNREDTWGGDFDLLSFGFPCQDLSIAKKDRKGLDGERSGLFYEALRILKEVKPKYFLAENVASMSKEMKDIISKELGVEPIVINSDRFVQQNRQRIYWTNIDVQNIPERPNWNGQFYQWRRTHFRKNQSGVCPTLTANMGTGGHNVPLKSENKNDKLTPNECARLQGFPDNYHDGISNTQAYKCYGNSFTVPVIQHILKYLEL
jgi:DNA-cytosine methyltransferase